jgi:hypothetical protein
MGTEHRGGNSRIALAFDLAVGQATRSHAAAARSPPVGRLASGAPQAALAVGNHHEVVVIVGHGSEVDPTGLERRARGYSERADCVPSST